MDNSELQDMGIGQMLSEAAATQPSDGALRDYLFSSLNKHNNILSLTFDEIQCKSGKNFGGMSMDEFLANVWNVEETQTQFQSQPNENEPQQNYPYMAPNSRPTLARQPSFSIPVPLCGKTVDEIWSEIHREQHANRQNFTSVPCQSQPALGEMTLEDFLVRAGVVQESSCSSMKQLPCSPKESNSNTFYGNNRPMVDLGYGMGDKLGLSLSYQQNAARNMPGICFPTYQILSHHSVGEPSDSNSIHKCHSMTDWVEHSNKRRIIDGPPEIVVQRRQRRMIKNRESAARSRARKQAYTVELEAELNHLKEENLKLKQILAESERKRMQEMVQRKETVKRQKPTERLRTIRRVGSMCW
uniref:ABSCISIC ACID-INSENSITIVE 5-like protein 1 isoform X2 n=1 Tax=Momordica charantia TaxID=3673 RepID=A0A6J1DHL9_MOMCH